MTLALLTLALTFPGRDRFNDRPLSAAVDIGISWVSLLALLAPVLAPSDDCEPGLRLAL